MTKTRQEATAGPAALQPAGSARPDRPLQGIALMVAGVFLLSVMDTLTKVAVAELSTPVLIACRTAVVMLLVAPMVVRAGGWTVLRMKRPWGHALRGGLSVCSMLTFFEALRHLPLATTIAICFASPLLMTLMSVPLLRERVGPARWAAVVLGLCGVFVIVGPEVAKGSLGIGAVLALAAAFFYAGAMTCVRWLSSTESDLSMMVSQNAIMGLAGLVGLLFVPPTMPSPTMWGVIAASAAVLLASQRLTFRALRVAPVSAVAPFQYTELVWTALFGWLFWREWPGPHVWWGASLVVAAGLFTIWHERRRAMGQG
jgi:drug/metabolite transporter (DMT)-like permease